MTTTLYETVRRIVADELASLWTAELGVVQETHPHADASDTDNHAVTVALRDSGIVLDRVPVASPRTGVVSIPEVGDVVLVQFIGGSPDAPVVVGALHSDAMRPPANAEGQVVWHLPADADNGSAAHLELTSGDEVAFVVRLGSGVTLTLRDGDPPVELDVGGQAGVTVDSGGAVSLESNGDVLVKGNQVSIEAAAKLELKGAIVEIN